MINSALSAIFTLLQAYTVYETLKSSVFIDFRPVMLELEQIQVKQKHYRHHETIMFWKLGFIHFLFRKIMSYAVLSVILNANRFC